MTDLIDEITEDLREEKQSYITKKITKIFTICAVIAVVSVSIYVWKERTVKELEHRLGMWFNQAIIANENNNLDEAIHNLNKIIEYPHQQYAALAYLNKAALLIKQDKFDQAQKTLLEMSKQEHFNKTLKDLSKIIYLGNQLSNNKPESESTNEMLLNVSKDGRPWQLSGLQLKALYEIKHKQLNEAKVSLNKIIDSKVANKSSHDTASNLLAVISRAE